MSEAIWVIRYHRRLFMRLNPNYGQFASGHRFAVWTKRIGEAEKFYSVEQAQSFAQRHLKGGGEITPVPRMKLLTAPDP